MNRYDPAHYSHNEGEKAYEIYDSDRKFHSRLTLLYFSRDIAKLSKKKKEEIESDDNEIHTFRNGDDLFYFKYCYQYTYADDQPELFLVWPKGHVQFVSDQEELYDEMKDKTC